MAGQGSGHINPYRPAGACGEDVAGAPARMMDADTAARVIMAGVARDKALIVFPASIRWARRAYQLSPRLIERELLRQLRRERGKYLPG